MNTASVVKMEGEDILTLTLKKKKRKKEIKEAPA
jgi:hypothetical protein